MSTYQQSLLIIVIIIVVVVAFEWLDNKMNEK